MLKKCLLALFVMSAVVALAEEEKQIQLGPFTATIPAGYTPMKAMKHPTVEMTPIMGTVRKDGSQPAVIFNEIDVSKFPPERQARIPKDPMKDIEGFLGTTKARYKDYQHTPVEKVTIAGLPFAKIQWTGSTVFKGTKFEIKGLLYVHRDGDAVHQVMFMDGKTHANETIPIVEKMIESMTMSK